MVKIDAQSISQTEIQLSFDDLSSQVEAGTTFTIYRYNGQNMLDATFNHVTLDDLPMRDTGYHK